MVHRFITFSLFAQEHFDHHAIAHQDSHSVAMNLLPAMAVLAFFTAIVLVVAIPTVVYHRFKTRVAELNTAVKQQMIERGYSAEQILAVIRENEKLLQTKSTNANQMTPSKIPSETSQTFLTSSR